MKQKLILPSLLLAAALALGLTTRAVAADPAPLPASGSMGLLGQSFASLNYSYVHLDNSPVNADRYEFAFNQPLAANLDTVLGYDYVQNGLYLGDRFREQTLTIAARAYCANFTWGKPYAEAGVGYAWTHWSGSHDNSIVWHGGVGAEFQLAPPLTVTPYVNYEDAPDLARGSVWKYGVKANYWITNQWSAMAGLERNGHDDMTYTIGTNFRF